jgi:hypothetical protein
MDTNQTFDSQMIPWIMVMLLLEQQRLEDEAVADAYLDRIDADIGGGREWDFVQE